jgi:hypothetical protein
MASNTFDFREMPPGPAERKTGTETGKCWSAVTIFSGIAPVPLSSHFLMPAQGGYVVGNRRYSILLLVCLGFSHYPLATGNAVHLLLLLSMGLAELGIVVALGPVLLAAAGDSGRPLR